MNKIEHEGTGTCVKIERIQDADNAEQKIKWFLKVHKTYKLLWEAYFQFSFSHVFYSSSHFTNFSIFTHPKMSFTQKLIKIIHFPITRRILLQPYQVSGFLSLIA